MPYAPLRPCLLALTITLSLAGHPLSAVAEALHSEQNATRFFDLPAAPLGVTLSRIARDSNLTLSVAPALLQGKTSAPVNGMYTPHQAAERALAGSGLGLSITDSGALSVYPQAGGALNLGATNVSAHLAEDGRGHVDGFVATRSATATKTDTPILEIPQTINVATTIFAHTRRHVGRTQVQRARLSLRVNTQGAAVGHAQAQATARQSTFGSLLRCVHAVHRRGVPALQQGRRNGQGQVAVTGDPAQGHAQRRGRQVKKPNGTLLTVHRFSHRTWQVTRNAQGDRQCQQARS